MKGASVIDSNVIGRVLLVFFIVFLGHYTSLFVLDFSYQGIILLIVLSFGFIILLSFPRAFIYFMIISYPLLPLLWESTSIQLGGSRSLSINLGGMLKVLGLLFGIFFLVVKKANIFKYKMFLPIIIFISLSLAGVVLSTAKVYSLRQWVNYAMPVVFYFLILENINNFKEARRLLKIALIFFFTPSLIWVFWQILFYVPPEYIDPTQILSMDRYTRFTGINPNANLFGLELSLFLMLSVFFLLTRHNKKLYSFFFIGMLVLLFNSYSRSAWAAFLAAFSFSGLLRYRKIYIWFILMAALLIVSFPPLTDRFMARIKDKEMFTPRIHTVKIGMELFKERPVFGYGPGGYETSSIQGHVRGAYGVAGMDSHNEYMNILVEGGVIFFGAYLFMMYRSFRLSYDIYKLPHSSGSNYGLFMMSVIIIVLIVGLAGQSYRHAGLHFWTFMAIGEICLRQVLLSPAQEDI